MSTIQALIFGLIQGITEFLPVSSSAHLKLAKMLLSVENAESLVIFDLMCHLGTLVALLYFFRKRIHTLIVKDRKHLWLVLIGTLPLVPFYFLLAPLREFASAPELLGVCLMVTSLILFLGQEVRIPRRIPVYSLLGASELPMSVRRHAKDILWIGTLQASALIPGISRSASTISCARALGWKAKDAVFFSFLLSIPTVIGGNCLELLKIFLHKTPPISISITSCLIGFVTACTVGLVVIRFAFAFLEKGNLRPFAWYCLCAGIAITVYLNWF